MLILYGIPVAFIAWPVGGWFASIRELWRILTEVVIAQNGFGLCTGKSGIPSADSGKALIEWLHEDVINKLADKPLNQPLTFGDLRNLEAQDKSITLNMVTSNLSHNRPYLLPFQEGIFIFDERDFHQLFPKEVVEYLISVAPSKDVLFDDEHYHFLATGDAMPVLVATRMSLSFPLLFSAIPLYTIPAGSSSQPIQTSKLQRNWFSDGGISSNFPIHFFDAWFPGRPTFGINLTTWQVEGSGTVKDKPAPSQFSTISPQLPEPDILEQRVHLPKPEEAPSIFWQDLDNKLREHVFLLERKIRPSKMEESP